MLTYELGVRLGMWGVTLQFPVGAHALVFGSIQIGVMQEAADQ